MCSVCRNDRRQGGVDRYCVIRGAASDFSAKFFMCSGCRAIIPPCCKIGPVVTVALPIVEDHRFLERHAMKGI